MQKSASNISSAYTSQYKELSLKNLKIDGEIPKWLDGSFISIGPGQFEIGQNKFKHWFDGFALLKKFDFKAGAVFFQNRFLQSTEYFASNKLGHLNVNEFGTYASTSKVGRIKSSLISLLKGSTHDNCIVNTIYFADNYIAMTESNDLISFNRKDLSTNGKFNFNNKIPGHFTLAHPHLDLSTGELINIAIEIGRIAKYHIYKVNPINKEPQIIQSYSSDSLFYNHSFSVTKNYIILFKTPLVMNKYKLILGLPINDTISYEEKSSSFFVIIDKRTGQIREIETDNFVCLHSINAYENKNELVLDLICHSLGNPYDKLYLLNLCSNKPELPTGEIRRYIINLTLNNCKQILFSTKEHEFPRINYKICNGNDYSFIYSNFITHKDAKFFNAIQKLNIQTGNTQLWTKENYYLGEAIFVQRSNSNIEDDGILISIAFDESKELSSLLIIDASSMNLLAEIFLPIHIPFGLHGNFYETQRS